MLKDINMRDRLIIGASLAIDQYANGNCDALDTYAGEPANNISDTRAHNALYHGDALDVVITQADNYAPTMINDTPNGVIHDTIVNIARHAILATSEPCESVGAGDGQLF